MGAREQLFHWFCEVNGFINWSAQIHQSTLIEMDVVRSWYV